MADRQQLIDEDLSVFRALLLWLWHSHEKPWVYSDERARAIYGEIVHGYPSIGSPEELETYLPSEDSVESRFPKRRYLYLNPIDDGSTLVPMISIACDFGRSIPEVRIRLGLFMSEDATMRAFGYRFESPEGPGKHHYYHAQPIHGFDVDEPFMSAERWLPTACPTFPLDADDPVKLLLSLLIALYGISYISQVRPHVHRIERYLGEMFCQSLPELRWYRRIIIGSAKVKQEIHDTLEPDEFEKKMRAKYPKSQIVGISQGVYDRSGKARSGRESRRR